MNSVGRPSPHELLLELCARFVPARARGLSCLVEWRVCAGGDVERLHLSIGQGGCALTVPRRHARVALDLSQEDLAAVLEGRVSGAELFTRQRLVISGDVLLASRLPGLFLTGPRPGVVPDQLPGLSARRTGTRPSRAPSIAVHDQGG